MAVQTLLVDLVVRYGFQVLGAIAIVVAGLFVARWIGALVETRLGRQQLEPPLKQLIVRVAKVVVMLFALVVAIDKLGFQIAPLVAGIGVAGLGIGIALQGVLSNVVAGLNIIFTKPFRVGEHIAVAGVHGDVVEIGLTATVLVHADRSRVIVPNRKIVGEILHNYGLIRQLDLRVAVGYAADLGRATAAARAVVEADERVLGDPAAVIGVAALGDSAVTLAVRPWVAVANEVPAAGDLYRALIERFRAEGIDKPLPQREVRLLR
jgi:small conductance mechanosensitive channel